MKPNVSINLKKIYDNAKIVLENCNKKQIEVTAVTKLHLCDRIICETLLEAGVCSFGDSRLENLKNIIDLDAEKMMIRIPRLSEAGELVKFTDTSLISSLEQAKAINYEAEKINKIYNVLLMVDLGDLREGYFNKEQLFKDFKEMLNLNYLSVKGVGSNLTCYGGILPDNVNLGRLVAVKEELEAEFNVKLDRVSGGNSTSYHLVLNNTIPNKINNLRIGDTILFGRDCYTRNHIEGMNKNSFILSAEIVEIMEKPSVPIGKMGMAALNTKPAYVDRGIRKRAILSVGKQDIDMDIFPIDEDLIILGASSDHLIVDITDSKNDYKIGDRVDFYMYYTAALRSFTSKYVTKEYING